MHGRESIPRLFETMDIIKRWDKNETLLNNKFETYLQETNLENKPINIWRDKIKNCKFDCWECQYCDKIYDVKSDLYYSELVKHVAECVEQSGIPKVNVKIPGLTSPRVQTLLNNLAQGVDTYLEVGSYLGATMCAVLKDNPITAVAIDNWEVQVQSQNGEVTAENNIDIFVKNVEKYKGHSIVNIVNSDLFAVNTEPMQGKIKMFFYDGPHDQEVTKKAVQHYWPTLADEAIIVFDDANWKGVVDGAREGINLCNGQVTYEKMMLNSIENKNEWWNGLYIVVVRK